MPSDWRGAGSPEAGSTTLAPARRLPGQWAVPGWKAVMLNSLPFSRSLQHRFGRRHGKAARACRVRARQASQARAGPGTRRHLVDGLT